MKGTISTAIKARIDVFIS